MENLMAPNAKKKTSIALTELQVDRITQAAEGMTTTDAAILSRAIDIGLREIEEEIAAIDERRSDKEGRSLSLENQRLVQAKLQRRGKEHEEAIRELEAGTPEMQAIARKLRFGAGD